MIIKFHERFALPVEDVFGCFDSPANWPRLYGFAGGRDVGDGWFAVGIKGFPFPLVARCTLVEPNRQVRRVFKGFWRSEGEIRFTPLGEHVVVEGYETISMRWLFLLSPVLERLLLEARFRAIWQLGWRRLRKLECAEASVREHCRAGAAGR